MPTEVHSKKSVTFGTYSHYIWFIVALTAGFNRGDVHVTSDELLGRSEQGLAVSDISLTVQTLPELVNFRLTQSLKGNKLNSKQSETRTELFLTEMKAQ